MKQSSLGLSHTQRTRKREYHGAMEQVALTGPSAPDMGRGQRPFAVQTMLAYPLQAVVQPQCPGDAISTARPAFRDFAGLSAICSVSRAHIPGHSWIDLSPVPP